MEKNVKMSLLCQVYGKLLTEKQYVFLDDYYNNDLSLSEIAENNNITRQAVRDILKKGEVKLLEYEQKLGIMEKVLRQEKVLNEISAKICEIQKDIIDKKVIHILDEIKIELDCLADVVD